MLVKYGKRKFLQHADFVAELSFMSIQLTVSPSLGLGKALSFCQINQVYQFFSVYYLASHLISEYIYPLIFRHRVNSLLDTYTLFSNRHLELSVAKTEPLIFHSPNRLCCQPSSFQ